MTELVVILLLAVTALFVGHRGRGALGPICWVLIGVILAGGTISAAASHGGNILATAGTAVMHYVGGRA